MSITIELTTIEATFVRHALDVAEKTAPWVWDAEQIEALHKVSERLCDAQDLGYQRS